MLDKYLQFRAHGFLWLMLVGLAIYEALHWFVHLDPDRSNANYWLSVDASVTGALLIGMMFKSMAQDRANWARMESEIIQILREVHSKIVEEEDG